MLPKMYRKRKICFCSNKVTVVQPEHVTEFSCLPPVTWHTIQFTLFHSHHQCNGTWGTYIFIYNRLKKGQRYSIDHTKYTGEKSIKVHKIKEDSMSHKFKIKINVQRSFRNTSRQMHRSKRAGWSMSFLDFTYLLE